jgi:hypothetical protein
MIDMVEYEIACPHHGRIEKVTVPDSYKEHAFEGEIRCTDPENPQPIKIKIVRGNVIEVLRA